MKNKAAQELGKKGGLVTSEKKTAANREKAKLPRGKWVTAFSFDVVDEEGKHHHGLVMVPKKLDMGLDTNGEELWKMMAEAVAWRKPVGKLELYDFHGRALRIGGRS